MTVQVLLGDIDLTAGAYMVMEGTFDTQTPGRVAFAVDVDSSTMSGVRTAVEAIQTKLDEAAVAADNNASSWVTLGAQFDTPDMVYYDIISGQISVTPASHTGVNFTAHQVVVIVELVTTLFPHYAAVSGGTQSAMVGDAAKWLQEDVAGSRGAHLRLEIEDTSITGVINRIRFTRRAASSAVLGDYDPWVDMPAAGSATDEVLSAAFGGTYAELATSSTSWVDLARGTMPAGGLNQGRFDIWALVKSTGTVMSAPSSLNGVPDEPGSSSLPNRVQVANGTDTDTTVAASWGGSTVAGNGLFAFVRARALSTSDPNVRQSSKGSGVGTSASASWDSTTLSGSTLVAIIHSTNAEATAPSGMEPVFVELKTNAYTYVFIEEDAGVDSGSVSSTLDASVGWRMVLVEIENVAATNVIDVIASVVYDNGDRTSTFVQASNQTTTKKSVALGIVSSQGTPGTMTGGFSSIENSSNLRVGANEISDGPTQLQFFASGTSDFEHVGVIVNFRGEDNSISSVTCSPPAGWSTGGEAPNFANTGEHVNVWFFYWPDAPSDSGSVTFTFSESVDGECIIMEYENVDPNATIQEVSSRTGYGTSAIASSSGVADQSGTLALAVFGNSNEYTFASYTGGFVEFQDVGGIAAAEETTTTIQSFTSAAAMSFAAAWSSIMVIIRQELPEGGTPGSLVAGTYAARVQAVDITGNPTNATSSISDVVSTAGSAIAYTWSAPSGNVSYYYLSWELGGEWRRIITTETSYTLSDPEDGQILSAAPSTSGATAAPPRMRALIGTAGTPTADMLALPEVVLPGVDEWLLVNIGNGRDLPPVGATFDTVRPEWAIDVETLSPNGLSSTVQIDALWLASHNDPQATIEYPNLDLATKYRWVIESNRRGKGLIAWLENISTDAESGQVVPVGYIDLAEGDNVNSLVLEQADGVIDLDNARVNVTVTYWPRVRWQ